MLGLVLQSVLLEAATSLPGDIRESRIGPYS